jgi:hypothetical protein
MRSEDGGAQSQPLDGTQPPVNIPHDIENRGVATGIDQEKTPQLSSPSPPPPQVTESARLNLSRWRHGFEPRWDYKRNRRSERRHRSNESDDCAEVGRPRRTRVVTPTADRRMATKRWRALSGRCLRSKRSSRRRRGCERRDCPTGRSRRVSIPTGTPPGQVSSGIRRWSLGLWAPSVP